MYGAKFRYVFAKWCPTSIRPGDRVRILFGPLAGTKATVVRLSDRHRCVLRLDGLDENVHVILPADDVRRSK